MDERNPISDGLTRQEVWKLLDTYNSQWKDRFDRHSNALDRNTQTTADGFKAMAAMFAAHEADDRKIERRVDHLEMEDAARVKRYMTLSGIVSLIVGPVSAWLFRKMFP